MSSDVEFPEFTEGKKTWEYLIELDEYQYDSIKKDYNIIFEFFNKWLKGKRFMIKSLEDFKDVSQDRLPDESKCKKMLKNYAERIASKLGFEYEYDKKNIIEQNKKLIDAHTKSSKKVDNDNAAHNTDYPFTIEFIKVLRKALSTIDYKFYSHKYGKTIKWRIERNNYINDDRYKGINKSKKSKIVTKDKDETERKQSQGKVKNKLAKKLNERELKLFAEYSGSLDDSSDSQ